MVGIVMGIHATGYLILKQPSINFIDLISYLPVFINKIMLNRLASLLNKKIFKKISKCE